MIVFWTLVASMLVIPLIYLAPAILGKTRQSDQDRQQQNIAIAREQLNVLEADRVAGTITDTEFEQTRAEIERALYHDVTDNQQEAEPETSLKKNTSKGWLLLLLLIPLVSIPLYFELGRPQLADKNFVEARQQQQQRQHANQSGQMDLFAAAAGLAKKMEENPGDPKGWFLLGQTYMAIKEYPKAVAAFSRSYQLKNDDPRVMLRYADAISMTRNGRMQGMPFELVKKAIKLVPTDPTALWLMGIGYAEEGNFKQALHYWELLLPLVAEDPASTREVEKIIQIARQKMGSTGTVTASPTVESTEKAVASNARIQLTISLGPELKSRVSPEDTVFIFARALSGPRMPLAAVRKQVKDLPVSVTLDDSQAMQARFRLSQYPEVLVGARISKSGRPMASAGDFYGEISPVVPAEQPQLTIEINRIVE